MSEKDFEETWALMNAAQRENYTVDLLMAAFNDHKITIDEVTDAIEIIVSHSNKFTILIPLSLIKMFKVIAEGGVRFTIKENRLTVKSMETATAYIKFIESLSMKEQVRIKSDAINLLHDLKLLETEEANEALSDVMKMSIFEDYNYKSEGSLKVNRILEMVFDMGGVYCDSNRRTR